MGRGCGGDGGPSVFPGGRQGADLQQEAVGRLFLSVGERGGGGGCDGREGGRFASRRWLSRFVCALHLTSSSVTDGSHTSARAIATRAATSEAPKGPSLSSATTSPAANAAHDTTQRPAPPLPIPTRPAQAVTYAVAAATTPRASGRSAGWYGRGRASGRATPRPPGGGPRPRRAPSLPSPTSPPPSGRLPPPPGPLGAPVTGGPPPPHVRPRGGARSSPLRPAAQARRHPQQRAGAVAVVLSHLRRQAAVHRQTRDAVEEAGVAGAGTCGLSPVRPPCAPPPPVRPRRPPQRLPCLPHPPAPPTAPPLHRRPPRPRPWPPPHGVPVGRMLPRSPRSPPPPARRRRGAVRPGRRHAVGAPAQSCLGQLAAAATQLAIVPELTDGGGREHIAPCFRFSVLGLQVLYKAI